MAGVGETTAALRRMRRALQAAGDTAAGGDAAMTEIRNFGSNPGALRMMTYAPAELSAGAPLVVVLHGCTQQAGLHASAAGWLALADRFGFAVLAPEQSRHNNAHRCFNWFQPEDARRGQGEAASIAAMVAHLLTELHLDPERVFVTGLSAGGAMTAVMLAAYPDLFSAGAVVAGVPFGLADNVQEALHAMHGGRTLDAGLLGDRVLSAGPEGARVPRLSVWHGQADHTVNSSNAMATARQWAAAHGLDEHPHEILGLDAGTRSLWRGEDGEVLVECTLLQGFGHGTPLAAQGEGAVGFEAPFMIEAGISSSLEIARFWGLAPADTASLASLSLVTAAAAADAAPPSVGEGILAQVTPHVAPEVGQVIAQALKAAGLMK